MGGCSSSTVEEAGNCRSRTVTATNRIVTSLGDKEEPTIVWGRLFAISEILHSLKFSLESAIELAGATTQWLSVAIVCPKAWGFVGLAIGRELILSKLVESVNYEQQWLGVFTHIDGMSDCVIVDCVCEMETAM